MSPRHAGLGQPSALRLPGPRPAAPPGPLPSSGLTSQQASSPHTDTFFPWILPRSGDGTGQSGLFRIIYLFIIYFNSCIYLTAPGLSCYMRDL